MVTELSARPPAGRIDAVETVRRYLLHLIDLGRLGSGERLPTAADIAHAVGVSRPIVLQAAKMLEAEGRVLIRHGGGMWVRPLSADNVDIRRARVWRDRVEIQQHAVLREMLEAGMAYRLADVGLAAERIEAARELNARMKATDDRDLARRLDTEFHATLAGGAGLPLVEQALQDSRAIVSSAFEFLPWRPDRYQTSFVEHEQLLAAIAGLAPASAQELARVHAHVSSVLIDEVLGGEDSSRLVPHLQDGPISAPPAADRG